MKRYLPFACLSLWRHYISLIDTAVKVTTWGLGIKNNFIVWPASYYFLQTLFWPVTEHFNFN